MMRFVSKGILLYLILISFYLYPNSYEASASGMSYERLQKIAPTLNELYLKTGKFPGFISAVFRLIFQILQHSLPDGLTLLNTYASFD